jgi:riboflavin kinase
MTTTPEKTAEDIQVSSGRPSAPLRTDTFRKSRPDIVGADTVESPFPIFLSGAVQRGFGRGGKDLGCPTGELAWLLTLSIFIS